MQHTLQNLSRPVLKELARARGLSQQGRKADVADRLIEHGFTESDLPEIGTEAEPEAAEDPGLSFSLQPCPLLELSKMMKDDGG